MRLVGFCLRRRKGVGEWEGGEVRTGANGKNCRGCLGNLIDGSALESGITMRANRATFSDSILESSGIVQSQFLPGSVPDFSRQMLPRRATSFAPPGPARKVPFGRDENFVAPPFDSPVPRISFGHAVGINVRGIEHRGARLRGQTSTSPRGLRDIARAPRFEQFSPRRPNRAGPEAQNRNPESRKRPVDEIPCRSSRPRILSATRQRG